LPLEKPYYKTNAEFKGYFVVKPYPNLNVYKNQNKEMGAISMVELGIWLVYFSLILVLLVVFRVSKTESHYRFFIPAFILKVFGGIGFAIIYIYYYKFGDTFLYHRGATVLANALVDTPADYFRLLASTNANLPVDLSDFSTSISYSRGAEEWFMVKLLSPIALLSFGSYLVTTLFMSFISFFGGWKLFLVFRDLLPKREWLAFIAAFLIPSALFWGGGIMKDTFTLTGINLVIYGLYFTVYKGKVHMGKYILVAVSAFIVLFLKGYVIIAFVPGLLFGINALIKNAAQSQVLRQFLGLVFLVITVAIIYLGPQYLGSTSSKYTAAALEGRVKGFHTWHTDVGGATYNLGEVEYTALGILMKVPSALNVTFFRPYLWESGNPVVIIAALESTVLFLLFLYILMKLRWNFIRYIREKPILITFYLYCLIFGFVVGFTSYNFGALGRYKIPIYSVFVFILLYLFSRIDETNKLENEELLDDVG
jgi:hypothetical protein